MSQGKIFRRGLTVIFILACLLTTTIVCAVIQTFDGEGKYIMSDFENPDIARQRAQQCAERDAKKKVSVYLTNFSRTVNANLTDNEISAVTNNIIKISDVKIVPVSKNGKSETIYRATLKASIDRDGIYAFIKRDSRSKAETVQKNNNLQDAIATNDKLVEDLKKQYKRATSQAEKDRIREQMNDADRDFLNNQKNAEGLKLFYFDDYDGAIKLYTEFLNQYDSANAHYNRGTAYAELKQYEQALQDFNEAVKLNPNHIGSYNNRGYVYKVFGQYEQAIQDYTKAIQLDPDYAGGYINRGMVYYDLEQYEQAIQDFDKAIEIDKDFDIAYYNRGATYAELKQYERALQDLNKSIELNPNYSNVYLVRGAVYYQLKNYEQAIKDFDKAIELDSNSFAKEVYFLRASTYLALKNYEQAIKDFDKLIEINPNFVDGYLIRGEIHRTLKNYAQAIEDFSKAIELGVNDKDLRQVYNKRGLAYEALGETEKAQADFAKAKELGYKD